MEKFFKWILLLNKRLFKKKSFIFLIFLIPLSVFLLSVTATEKSGFLNIALTYEEKTDPYTTEIFKDLQNNSKLINYEIYPESTEAISLIKSGKIDAVWIFPSDIEGKIESFIDDKSSKNAVVHVIEREENVALNLSHEKLTGALYKHCSKAQYIKFARTKAKQLDNLTDEELLKYFNDYQMIGDLFSIHTPFSNTNQKQVNFVLTPIRGILSLLIVLGGFAASLYYIGDERRGTYSLISLKYKPLIALANQIITCFCLSVVVLISIFFSGLALNPLKEILCMLLFILASASFCLLILSLIGNYKLFSALVPLIIICISILCPVFIDFRINRFLPFLFPVNYYLNGLYNNKYILYMGIYCVACLLITYLIKLIKKSSTV